MRFIQTFVVHIYVDTEVPEQLCGNLRSLEETGIVPFKNPKELEAKLRRLIRNPSLPEIDRHLADPGSDK